VISNQLVHAFLIYPLPNATRLSKEAQSVFRTREYNGVAEPLDAHKMASFDIPLHEASCSCICEERPETVPECDKGLIDHRVKGQYFVLWKWKACNKETSF